MNKILIVGNLQNSHLIRLVESTGVHSHCKYQIDGFSFNSSTDESFLKKIGYTNVYLYTHYFPKCIYRIPKIRFIFSIIDFIISFLHVKNRYDVLNIHYLTIESFFLYPLYRHIAKIIMISPWGSDVYRIPKWYMPFFKYIYSKIDLVSVPPIKFRTDLVCKFNLNERKIVNLGFGSKQIDLINSTNISKEEAKRFLGLGDKIVITCGYNANVNQQHNKIIDAIKDKKNLFPSNIVLLFPMTYNEYPKGYINQIKDKLEKLGVDYILYSSYLSDKDLMIIQKSTDIFIHIQKTDAYSASVQENILCNNFIINGSWIRYPDLETDGIPYYLVDETDDIAEIIRLYIDGAIKLKISSNTLSSIIKNGWSIKGQQWDDFFSNLNNL